MTRVAVVGAGMVGATTAARIAEARLCDHVALIDVAGDLARAMALDIGSSLPLLGSDTTLTGGESYDGRARRRRRRDHRGPPAPARAEPRRPARGQRPHRRRGLPRGPHGRARRGRDRRHQPARRDDDARPGRPRLPARARRRHGRPARHRALPPLPGRARRSPGEHRATRSRWARTATRWCRSRARRRSAAAPRAEVLGAAALDEVVQRTRDGGAEVVRLLQRGSAYWAPSAAVMLMVRAILRDEQVVLPIAARLSGQFGIDGVYVGVPARLGRRGVVGDRHRRARRRRGGGPARRGGRGAQPGGRSARPRPDAATLAAAGAGRCALRRRRSSTPCAARCSERRQ